VLKAFNGKWPWLALAILAMASFYVDTNSYWLCATNLYKARHVLVWPVFVGAHSDAHLGVTRD
jgi:hypothetical protein